MAEVEWFLDFVSWCWLVYFCVDSRCDLSRVLDGSVSFVCFSGLFFFWGGGGGGGGVFGCIKAMFMCLKTKIYCLTSYNCFERTYYG